MTVCEILSNRMLHNGKPVIVVGKYFADMERVFLDADCKSKVITDGRNWSNSIWLAYNRDVVAPSPDNVPKYTEYELKIFSNLPDAQPEKWKVVQGCSYFPGTWAAIYGRFETEDPFPLVRSEPIGFGHLGMYIARLVHPPGGEWCMVPAQKYPEYVALEKKRQEDSKAALWRNLEEVLQSAGGLDYFDEQMKDAVLPSMRGTVTSIDWSPSVSIIMLAMSGTTTPEIRLEVRPPLSLLPGTEVEFIGVAIGCTLKPFLLTLNVAANDLQIVGKQSSVPKP